MTAPTSPKLRLGLPKGSLQDTTGKLLGLAGYRVNFQAALTTPRSTTPRSTAS